MGTFATKYGSVMAEDSVPPAPARGAQPARPTIHDVARHAGVAAMTVSRVLAGGEHVRPAMRERVEASIRELGYRRNENARSIRPGQRSGLIGVSVTNIANPYYAQMLLGIDEVAAQRGRRILIGNSAESSEKEATLVEDFIGRQTEGLIVVPASDSASHLMPDALGGTPLVLASRSVHGADADAVLVADVSGARTGTAQLLAEGHRRIAFLGNIPAVSTSARRFEGFRQAHLQFGVEPDPALIRRNQQDVASAYDAMRELLELPEPPTAVFSANNRNTIGVLRALMTRGDDPRPPVAVTGFDDFELSDLLPYPVTIINHDARELGRIAATFLLERLDGEVDGSRRREVEVGTTLVRYPQR